MKSYPPLGIIVPSGCHCVFVFLSCKKINIFIFLFLPADFSLIHRIYGQVKWGDAVTDCLILYPSSNKTHDAVYVKIGSIQYPPSLSASIKPSVKCVVWSTATNNNTRFSTRDDRVNRISPQHWERTADTGTYWCRLQRSNGKSNNPFFLYSFLLQTIVQIWDEKCCVCLYTM